MFYRVRSLEVINFNFVTENQGKLTLFSLKHIHPKSMYCLHWGLISYIFLFSTKKIVEQLSEDPPCYVISEDQSILTADCW